MILNIPIPKLIVYLIVLMIVVYDATAECRGWTTISAATRDIDAELGSLPRWFMLALWFHLFVGFWPKGNF